MSFLIIENSYLLLTATGVMNWFVGFLTTFAIFAIMALALNTQWGFTGIFNFGVVSFFMVGAYTSALFTIGPPGEYENYIMGFELPILFGWFAAMITSGIVALLIGLPTLRLQRDFLAIATIGIAAILRAVALSTEGFVNRARGMNGIPRMLGDVVSGPDYKWVLLAITLITLIIVYVLVEKLTASPWGRVLRSIRENEETTKSVGKDTVNYRMQAFVLGAMIMGLGGAIWAHRMTSIDPEAFNDLFGTFLIWTMVMVGGNGSNKGAVMGAFLCCSFWFGFPLIQESLPDILGNKVFQLREISIGVLIILFLLYKPNGVIPEKPKISRHL